MPISPILLSNEYITIIPALSFFCLFLTFLSIKLFYKSILVRLVFDNNNLVQTFVKKKKKNVSVNVIILFYWY